jgi:hypothetical protein
MSEQTRYLVTTQTAEFVIEVDSDWKLTFGAVNPGAPPHGRDLHCLRIWDGPNAKTAHLRAVFCDVRGFRDLSLPLARKLETQTSAAEWKYDSDGGYESKHRRQIEKSWETNGAFGEIEFP